MIEKETCRLLVELADRYETKDFLKNDPSKFMHRYSDPIEQETAAFIAANIAFGKREQIIKHVDLILQAAGKNLTQWVQNKGYRNFFTKGSKSFYRMYTHDDFLLFFDTIFSLLDESGSIGNHIKNLYCNKNANLSPLICNLFNENCHLIPHSKNTAAKRINMFLRWMTRDESPVDLGLWKGWHDKKNLLIPLDTHVMKEAEALNLLTPTRNGKTPAASLKTDIELTSLMNQVFPGDPCRADYALFGFGVDKDSNK